MVTDANKKLKLSTDGRRDFLLVAEQDTGIRNEATQKGHFSFFLLKGLTEWWRQTCL
jgi:hypothetical protein